VARSAFAACGLDQEALPLGTPFSPKGKGAGGRASLHPAESLLRCMGVNGALRRVLTRSVLACGCAPLRLSRPPLTPMQREIGPTPSHPPGTAGWALHASYMCRSGMATKPLLHM